MAQLVLAAAGAAIGGLAGPGVLAFGMTGAQLGWMAGGLLASAFTPAQKQYGPRLGDLSVGGSSYGAVIPYVEGHPRLAGQIVWASSKREIATTTRHGKGGGGTKVTTYSYEVDLLIMLTANEIEGVSRVWSGGDLVFNQRTDADYTTLLTSLTSPRWSRMTVYGGGATQTPDPDYEAAVGSGNAPAYRGRGTVFIKSLQLGQSGQIPNLTFEVVRTASAHYSQAFFVEEVSKEYHGPTVSELNPIDVLYPPYIETGVIKFGTSSYKKTAPNMTQTAAAKVRQYLYGRDFTMEGWVYITAYPTSGNAIPVWGLKVPTNAGGPWHKLMIASDGKLYPRVYDDATNAYGYTIFGVSSSLTGVVSKNPQVIPLNTWVHVVLQRHNWFWSTICDGFYHQHTWEDPTDAMLDPGTVVAHYGNIAVAQQSTYEGLAQAGETGMEVQFNTTSGITDAGNKGAVTKNGSAHIDSFRLSGVARYPAGSYYAIPTSRSEVDADTITLYNFDSLGAIESQDPTIAEVTSRLCERSGMTASQYDVTALSSITTKVRGLTISQVSSARSVLEQLMACYFYEAVVGDKIKFVPRAGAVVATIPYADLGWEANKAPEDDPLPLRVGNELELPAQLALTYSNVDSDWQSDTQYSDRVFTGQESAGVLQVPMGFTASEAKVIVDARLTDMYVALMTAQISLSIAYAKLQPTDPIYVTGKNGELYRMRVVRRSEAQNVLSLNLVQDDATVFTQLGLTSGGSGSQTAISAVPDTSLEILDIPLLRDTEDYRGYYLAVHSDATKWPGAEVYMSPDNVVYSRQAIMGTRAVYGTCQTILGDWAESGRTDESNSVSVIIEYDSLDSYTVADMLNSTQVNAALIGNEIVQFRTATLTATKTYTLTGFFRGRRGTEQYMRGHGASERFILLATGGMQYVPLNASDLNRLRYFKAPSAGQTLSAADAETATVTGVSLKPFSPVSARINMDSTDVVFTWNRRTRLSTSIGGSAPQSIPLGEASEKYEVDIFSDRTYTTLKRTISSTSPTCTYTAAQQTTDFGSTQSHFYLRIYQISDTVGRGFPLEVSLPKWEFTASVSEAAAASDTVSAVVA